MNSSSGTNPGATSISFCDWLKHKRNSLDLTREDLAELIDCSVTAIRKLESGERRPSRQVAELLAVALGVPSDERTAFVHFARAVSERNQAGPLRSDSDIGTPSLSPWRIHNRQHSNLPVPPTPLIGREQEVQEIQTRLLSDRVRLLTLTGAPGIGKTRLAQEAASELADHFEHGVFFVGVARINDPELVIPTIAATLHLKEAGDRPLADLLKSYLGDKRVLLVLDNFEQIVEAAPQVTDLLATCPWLKVLITSRTPLQVRGERQFTVPPLALPDITRLPATSEVANYSAVQLFVERAQDLVTDFELTDDNAGAVAAICVQLDGLPLAIELAAPRINLLTPQEILARLDNRLKALAGGLRDLPARQQTLRSAISWSYDLLDGSERSLFTRLGVFVGGCTLGAVEKVCNARGDLPIPVLGKVKSLVTKSLLRQEMGEDGEPRFTMLETIREFAWEQLECSAEAQYMSLCHGEYYMALAEEAEPHLIGSAQEKWFTLIEKEHDNLRAAMRWARVAGAGHIAGAACKDEEGKYSGVVEPAEVGLRIAGALWRFWYVRGFFSEGREQLAGMLALSTPSAAEALHSHSQSWHLFRAKALNGAGVLAYSQGNYHSARSLYEESLSIKRKLADKAGVALSLNNLGIVTHSQGEYASALSLYEESYSIMRELGDKHGMAGSFSGLGSVAYSRGEYGISSSLYEESLSIRRELGDKWGIATSLTSLGRVALRQGEYASALSLYEESLSIRRELGDKAGVAASLSSLGVVAHSQGEYASARSLLEEGLAIWRELGSKLGMAGSLSGLGGVAFNQGEYASACSLYEESLAIRRELGGKAGIAESAHNLGNVVYCQGNYAAARSLYEGSLSIRRELRGKLGIAASLVGLGCVAAELAWAQAQTQTQAQRGARLLGAAEAQLEAISAVLDAEDRMVYKQGVASVRAQLSEEEFEKAWAEGRAMTTGQAIAYALEKS